MNETNNSNQSGIDVYSGDHMTTKTKWDYPVNEQHHDDHRNIGSDKMVNNLGSGQEQTVSKFEVSKKEMQDLLLIAELLENALNESNSANLRSIFENYFQIDCSILFKSKDRMYGSSLIFNHYQSLLHTFSNCCFRFSVKEKHHCLIVLEEYCVGNCPVTEALQKLHDIDYLWKCFDILNFPSESERLLFRTKFYDKLNMNNIPVSFTLKLDLYLVMNENMSRITHATWEVVSLDFTDQDFFMNDLSR